MFKKQAVKKISHEDVQHAMKRFFAQGGTVKVIDPQSDPDHNTIGEGAEPLFKQLWEVSCDPLRLNTPVEDKK